LWYPQSTDESYNGCGYVGTYSGASPVMFGEGCDGCLNGTQANYRNDPNSSEYVKPEEDTSLVWLWIIMPIFLIAIIFGLGYWCTKRSQA
jgi:hypothetical protein